MRLPCRKAQHSVPTFGNKNSAGARGWAIAGDTDGARPWAPRTACCQQPTRGACKRTGAYARAQAALFRPLRLRCLASEFLRAPACKWRAPAHRDTVVAGYPRCIGYSAFPHLCAQSFAPPTGWRVGGHRRVPNGCGARLHPARLRQADHVVAGCPDPSACVCLRYCTMVCGVYAAVLVLCG